MRGLIARSGRCISSVKSLHKRKLVNRTRAVVIADSFDGAMLKQAPLPPRGRRRYWRIPRPEQASGLSEIENTQPDSSSQHVDRHPSIPDAVLLEKGPGSPDSPREASLLLPAQASKMDIAQLAMVSVPSNSSDSDES
ncbi:hypothetical protein KIN20_001633 [Parelaphostrongylus tenuis]|uniref:Uncharacterized protein n=1 Tax=Parelaphostrongylus tenuis TaxID=148309 RepID=A0AAD5QH66_PARTN|nr:hypothetical protein KIN20_001633 [Parelaphostrongylus tenuis]